jgi:hypothetical protein
MAPNRLFGWLPVKGPNGFGALRKIDNINTNDNINRDPIKQLPKLSNLFKFLTWPNPT